MSNSRWRVVGLNGQKEPYSNSEHETEEDARERAENQLRRKTAYAIFAVMPHSESVMVADAGKPEKLMQNMEKVLHSHPEWFFDDQSEDRYMEWKRQNFPASQVFSTPGPRKPKPQLPPEVWAKPNPNTDYMAAVRSMCGESGKGE